MKYSLNVLMIMVFMLFIALAGCSSKGIPVTPSDNSTGTTEIPIIGLQQFDDSFHALGLMGAYELSIDIENTSAELISKRSLSLGESFIVNGISFFTMTPCSDCLDIASIELTEEHYIKLNFSIRHPFDEGDPFKPPSALNRSDLNVFDLAMLIQPKDATPKQFNHSGVAVHSGFSVNQAGYTRELFHVTGENAAIPFFLVVDDSTTGESTWNIFEQGSDAEFPIILDLEDSSIMFDLYLTMGYGASATRPTRLAPDYYNPEFNRKAAWKVDVTVSDNWMPYDSTTTNDVTVKVYDWQIGAPVNPNLDEDYEIYAASDVSSVSIEIPGMFDTLKIASEPDISATGMPDDPLVFTFAIANENLLETGEYTGLVKVVDERVPPSNPLPGQTDALVDVPDGINITYMAIPEFVTYQTFKAVVYDPPTPAVVLAINPDKGLVDEIITDVVITGENFDPDATVELEYEPGVVITGHNIEWIDSTTIHVDFDLTGAELGFYDVVVTNPFALPGVLEDGFEVVEYQIILWQTSQGNSQNTGYKPGLSGPSGTMSAPTWEADYIIGRGNPLLIFLNEDTAFYSMSVNYGTFLPTAAVNLSDGTTKWTQYFGTEAGDSLRVVALSDDGSIVLCAQRIHSGNPANDRFYALDADDGSELWSMNGSIRPGAYPTLDMDGNFIIPIRDVGFRSVVPETGAINWTSTIGNPEYCTPAVGENNIMYGYVNPLSNAQIIALHASDGSPKWTIDTPAAYIGRCDNDVTIHPNGNIIVFSQNGLHMFSDDGNQPSLVWRQNYPYIWYAASGAVGPDEYIYLIDYDGVLRKIDPANGNTVQSSSGWGDGYASRLVIGDDGLIYTRITNNAFACFNTDLSLRWRYTYSVSPPQNFSAGALGNDGTVYSAHRTLGLVGWRD